MTIEIIARDTCPTCGGNGRFYDRDADDFLQCSSCHGVGTVPRVLATFADAAELCRAMAAGIRRGQWVTWAEYVPDGDETLDSLGDTAVEGYELIAGFVARDALGVTDDQG